jgi:hypothetical protein
MNSIRTHSVSPPWWLPERFKTPKTRGKSQVSAADNRSGRNPDFVCNKGLYGKPSSAMLWLMLGVVYICAAGPVYAHAAKLQAVKQGMGTLPSYDSAYKSVLAWPVGYGITEQHKAFVDIGPPQPGGAVRHGPEACPSWIPLSSRALFGNHLNTVP